jgi:hypothetical protein
MTEAKLGRVACLMYVMGAADSLDLATNGERRSYCAPATSTTDQFHDVLTLYLREHPEERHRPAVILLVLALSEAWPCR